MFKAISRFFLKKELSELNSKVKSLQNTISEKDNVFDSTMELTKTRISDLQHKLEHAEEKVTTLKDQLKLFTDEHDSMVRFSIDKNLKVSVRSKVNRDIIQKLVEDDFIDESDVENEDALQIALILICNESSEQLLMEINNDFE